jgi:hypothetical protein
MSKDLKEWQNKFLTYTRDVDLLNKLKQRKPR